jgi:transcriptional regulator with XRE-family HTH domain
MNERLNFLMDAMRAEAAVKRVSIKALAKETGVSYPAMRRYLNGERVMNLAQLYRAADVLGTTASDLVHEAVRREDAYRAAQGGPTDGSADRTSRTARRKTSEGLPKIAARSDEGATDELAPEVIDALAKSETARILEHEQVKRDGVTKSKRRSAS